MQQKNGATVHIYIRNTASLVQLPKIVVPVPFRIYTARDSTKQKAQPYLSGMGGKVIFADARTGLLKVGTDKKNLASKPVNRGDIRVLLDYRNAGERQTVQSALLALQEVYSIPFVIETEKKTGSKYDWVLTDKLIERPESGVLYLTSGKATDGYTTENVIQVPDSLRLATSDLVRNGRLPEWLGEKLLDFYGLKKNENQLSQKQLEAQFIRSETASGRESDLLYQWLLLAFVLAFILERWIALNKNVSRNYA